MRYETTLWQQGNNTGIEVPEHIMDALDAGRRPAVVVTVNGYEFRTTVGGMGGRAMLPFSAARRAESGLHGGDALLVDIAVDLHPRPIEVPDDLAAALDAADARAVFDALPPSKRKAHVAAVAGAKSAATRQRRIVAVVEALK
jgi:Bacteriocin-protection, YdeI or OmpD-Associated/Domain of unknown function (DUF1905)